jgi:hypothetical protein
VKHTVPILGSASSGSDSKAPMIDQQLAVEFVGVLVERRDVDDVEAPTKAGCGRSPSAL